MTKSSREFFPVVATAAVALIILGFVSMANAASPDDPTTEPGQDKIQCLSGSADVPGVYSRTCARTT